MKTVAYDMAEGVFMAVSGDDTLRDDEWQAMCERMRKRDFRVKLIYCGAAIPSSRQRMMLRQALGDVTEPVACLCGSMAARTALAIVSMFFQGMKGFAAGDLDGAIEHLDIPAPQQAALRSTMRRLAAEVGFENLF